MSQEEKEQKDPRLPESGGGGIQQTEKPPGNSPDMSGRAAGFSADAQAPPEKSASEGETPLPLLSRPLFGILINMRILVPFLDVRMVGTGSLL